MSKDHRDNVMFARKCLHYLSRDLLTPGAKALAGRLDQALRRGEYAVFNSLCSDTEYLRTDTDYAEVYERCQVASLIRFPLVDLDPDAEISRQREAVRECRISPNASDLVILRDAGRILTDWLDPIVGCRQSSWFHRYLRHGPGVVSETSDNVTKRKVVWVPRRIRRFESLLPLISEEIRWREAHSRTILVPKDHKSLRTIAAEPCWTQWVQQGVRGAMEMGISMHPILSRMISLRDQTQQHRRLVKGACTIDLSNASDTIKVKHLLLLKLPLEQRDFLLSLRTPMTEFKATLIPTQGLFPMGAAVCFPFESAFFSALCFAWCNAECPGMRPSSLGVYGDDIIVPEHLGGGLCRFLQRCGFSPNVNKTFIGTPFLESCGKYLYKGRDITPVKLKKRPPVSEADESNIAFALYALRLSERGFPTLGSFIQSRVKFKSSVRWNHKLHRLEQTKLVVSPRLVRGNPFFYPEALLHGSCDVALSTITVRHGWEPIL